MTYLLQLFHNVKLIHVYTGYAAYTMLTWHSSSYAHSHNTMYVILIDYENYENKIESMF